MGNSEKIALLNENLSILDQIDNELQKGQQSISDRRLQWQIRYGLLESIQIVIDIACNIVAEYFKRTPSNYRECIEILGEMGVLQNDIADRLKAMVGLRNLLVHEYISIDTEKLREMTGQSADFRAFINSVAEYTG